MKLSVYTVDRLRPWLRIVWALPALRWLYLGWTDGLGLNAPEFLIHSSGTWTMVALLLTLSISPLRVILRQPALLRLRRDLGLTTFIYASLHAFGWAVFEHGLSLSWMLEDVVKRPFVTFGALTWLLMLPLALTSNSWAMRRLGSRWQALHRLVYVLAITAVIHIWLHKSGKLDFTQVQVYGTLVAVLLGWRVVRYAQRKT